MRLAIVSYYSPPQAAIASHRVLRMSRALLAAGHDVHWVTADCDRFDGGQDASLGALKPAAVRVHGIDGQALTSKPAAANLWEKVWRTVAWHAPRKFAWPDSFLSWARKLKRELPRIVANEGVDAVLLSCSPHNQILAIPALRKRCPGVKIFVDYRDLLSGNPWNVRSPRLAERIIALEQRVLKMADVLFVNTESARERFLATVGSMPGLEIEVMRNAADFELGQEVAAEGPEPDLGLGVHLGFFGAVFPRRRLRTVLEAIAAIPPDRRAKLKLHVFCDPHNSATILEEDLQAVGGGVRDHVVRPERLGYVQALKTMRAMDALILVNGPEASDAVFIPGKMFDYLMARRPVVFVGHPGEASEIVGRTSGEDWVFVADDVAGVRGCLEKLLDGVVPDLEPVADYAPAAAFAPLLRRLSAS